MSNLSYNVLEKNIKIEDCFFDDFDIFLIKINGDTYSNISKLLLSYKKNIYSIFYRTSNEVCVLAEKDSLEIESLSDALNIHSKENDYDVELIEPEISDVLNLLLLSETKASDTSLYSFSYFNDAYYKILKIMYMIEKISNKKIRKIYKWIKFSLFYPTLFLKIV